MTDASSAPVEQVFAVPRTALFGPGPGPQGFVPAAELRAALGPAPAAAAGNLFAWIEDHGTFLPRPEAEADPTHKQIIPYVALTWGERLLVVERTKAQGEKRLHGMRSIGIGGHIDDSDLDDLDQRNPRRGLVLRGMQREVEEELEIERIGTAKADFLGLINDDRTEVGKVHIGLAFRVELALLFPGGPPRIRETHKMTGRFTPLAASETLWEDLGGFETWSRTLLEGVFLPPGGVSRRSRRAPTGQTSEDSDGGT